VVVGIEYCVAFGYCIHGSSFDRDDHVGDCGQFWWDPEIGSSSSGGFIVEAGIVGNFGLRHKSGEGEGIVVIIIISNDGGNGAEVVGWRRFVGVPLMELSDKVRRVFEVCGGFPRVVFAWVSFPVDEVL